MTQTATIEFKPSKNLIMALEFSKAFETYGVPNNSPLSPFPQQLQNGLDEAVKLNLFERGEQTIIKGPGGESLHQGAFYHLTAQGRSVTEQLKIKFR